MSSSISTTAPRTLLPDADRMGVIASILCAIHCGVAPILLLLLPTFGKIWAHPASHALVAIFIVPLAVYSIRKGYKKHQRRKVVVFAGVGIFFVLVGTVLPAVTEKSVIPTGKSDEILVNSGGNKQEACESTTCEAVECESATCESAESETTICESEVCESEACESIAGGESAVIEQASSGGAAETCVDNCCPSAQISETGEISIHVPPAAIVTTLGGVFLIIAHVFNLMGCKNCEDKCLLTKANLCV